jgi:hypothetical protein
MQDFSQVMGSSIVPHRKTNRGNGSEKKGWPVGLHKLFGGLFGNNNPTKAWVEDTSHPLDVDFGTQLLGGVAYGQPFTDLSWLGPADQYDDKCFSYLSKGLMLFSSEGQLDTCCVEFHRNDGFQPFQGTCLWKGKELELSPETTPDQLIAQLGKPAAHDTDDSNKTAMIAYGITHGQAEFEFNDNENGERTLCAVVMAC